MNSNQIRRMFKSSALSVQSKLDKKNWNAAIRDAERTVGYSTSFLSLRWILNDEVANIASHVSKLAGTNHPLITIAKNLLLRNERPTWGLIVLLVSKLTGLNSNFLEKECDTRADILHSQRILAEITEMIKTSHLMHNAIINIHNSNPHYTDLKYGNKLALLCGDYLLSTSFHELANLKNSMVQEIMSSAVKDLSEVAFLPAMPAKPVPEQRQIPIRINQGNAPFQISDFLGNMKSEWILRNLLSGGNLLAKSCQCSSVLANHDKNMQLKTFNLGQNLALAWQANSEKCLDDENFNLFSAPVMFHLQYDSEFYNKINQDNVDLSYVKDVVKKGPGLEKTLLLQQEFAEKTMKILDLFEDCESKTALVNMVKIIET